MLIIFFFYLGFYYFYLNNIGFGVLYLFIFGFFGVGWLIDVCLMLYYIKKVNLNILDCIEKSVVVICILVVFFVGFFGVYYYYLNRIGFGFLYIFIFGIFGVGYIVDWCCFLILFKCYNKSKEIGYIFYKYFDDVYFFWFLFGFFGFYYFYLNRCGWGLLYMYIFGFFGIGWFVDFCWMWMLVENCNRDIDE